MAKVGKLRRIDYRCHDSKTKRARVSTHSHKMFKDAKRSIKLSEKKDWEDATCSVCMESPHHAVLLLCSSYNTGCRPYMCATNYRFSNCLDLYKKAYSKATAGPGEKTEICELLCPLCRGQVKGWTLVEPARKYLDKKKRTCMHEKCSFVGNYKQLKKHVKSDHRCARPREVDPSVEEKWKSFENEREIDDVISTLPPGSVVLGDYVIDPNTNPFLNFDPDMDDFFSDDDDDDDDDDDVEVFETNRLGSGRFQFHRGTIERGFNLDLDMDDLLGDESEDDDDDDDDEDDVALLRRVLFNRSGRRRWW